MLLTSTLVANAGIVINYYCTVDSRVIISKQKEEFVRVKDCKENNQKIASSISKKSIFYVLANSKALCNDKKVESIRKCSQGQAVTLSNEDVDLFDMNKRTEIVSAQRIFIK